jgi:hypothetical protein
MSGWQPPDVGLSPGCPHICQRSSILSFKQTESWIPSINKILSLGMAGRVIVKFIGVRFIFSHSARVLCNLARIDCRIQSKSENKDWQKRNGHQGSAIVAKVRSVGDQGVLCSIPGSLMKQEGRCRAGIGQRPCNLNPCTS